MLGERHGGKGECERESRERGRGEEGAATIEGARGKEIGGGFFRFFSFSCLPSCAEARAPKKQQMPPEAQSSHIPSHSRARERWKKGQERAGRTERFAPPSPSHSRRRRLFIDLEAREGVISISLLPTSLHPPVVPVLTAMGSKEPLELFRGAGSSKQGTQEERERGDDWRRRRCRRRLPSFDRGDQPRSSGRTRARAC